MAAITGRAGGNTSRASGDQELGARMTGEANFLAENLSGRFAERAYRGNVHIFSVAAVTIPVNAATLVSVYGIYNPPGSGKVLELIDTDIVNVLATTVVGGYGWYSSTVAASALATFTTAGLARNARMQDPSSTVARVYTAVTHSGTPNLEAIIGGDGAATNTAGLIYKLWNGKLIIPQGVLASIAQTTNAGTASGKTIMTAWADLPA
jgi:hypothetical protein